MAGKNYTGSSGEADFITRTGHFSNHEMRKFYRAQRFINALASEVLEPSELSELDNESIDRKLFSTEFEREKIVNALVKSGLVKNSESLWGRIQIWKNMRAVHQTNYYKGHYFEQLNPNSTKYKLKYADVSGMWPG